MKKLFKRLLTFAVAVPFFVFVTWFCTYKNHLALNCMIVAAAVIATDETRSLLGKKLAVQPRALVLALAFLVSLSGLACTLFALPMEYVAFVFILALAALLVAEIFTKSAGENPFERSAEKTASSAFSLLYGAFLLSFLQRMTVWQTARENLTVFLLMVFICDSLAWLFGITMGKNNRGLVKASPNKSVAGFCGGFIGSVLIGVLAWLLLPGVFGQSPAKAALLGFATAAAAILGDLTESVLKRSAGAKDSGNVIPGRGGLLDSIDSIVIAAPVYVICAHFLFNFS